MFLIIFIVLVNAQSRQLFYMLSTLIQSFYFESFSWIELWVKKKTLENMQIVNDWKLMTVHDCDGDNLVEKIKFSHATVFCTWKIFNGFVLWCLRIWRFWLAVWYRSNTCITYCKNHMYLFTFRPNKLFDNVSTNSVPQTSRQTFFYSDKANKRGRNNRQRS